MPVTRATSTIGGYCPAITGQTHRGALDFGDRISEGRQGVPSQAAVETPVVAALVTRPRWKDSESAPLLQLE